MRTLVPAVLALMLIGIATPQAAPSRLVGAPRVISGDTLAVANTVVRLKGIDAPEKGQRCQVTSGRSYDCGSVSKTALMDLTVAVSVTCNLTGDKIAGLPVAVCFAGGYNLSKGMVHTGWALAWPRSGTIYAAVEAAARKAKHGLWRGTFVRPWQWRRGVRTAGPRTAPNTNGPRY